MRRHFFASTALLNRCRLLCHECAPARYASSAPTSSLIHDREHRVSVRYERGLPIVTVPLPSRQEMCQFSLRPISDTVGTLCSSLSTEDKGIDFVALYSKDGVRISNSTSIEHLLQFETFRLRINDTFYDVDAPESESLESLLLSNSSEKLKTLDDIKVSVASLHAVLNVEEFKLDRERTLLRRLEEAKVELNPLEEKKALIDEECEKRSERLLWGFFATMGVQTGIFARLTWWEYSWDIMEPVTYFATYATVWGTLGYFIITRQQFEYPAVRGRVYYAHFYKVAKQHEFNIERYNGLKQLVEEIERDLARLRDPLYQHLPAKRLFHLMQLERVASKEGNQAAVDEKPDSQN
ncbi:hypothetical protein L596_007589 [Steinernema carpocapsae]|uniref:Calcium uniporter protein n=1 Tax=Steinernema carpocapsae TaxID=34508 RepID=A0A4U5P9S1_STECR|nr:hypothetical protein L596_007589 [Steinernema carpocapsae]